MGTGDKAARDIRVYRVRGGPRGDPAERARARWQMGWQGGIGGCRGLLVGGRGGLPISYPHLR